MNAPSHIKPMLATLIDAPFDDNEWFFEIKMDGYRALAELNKNKVQLYSRNDKSFNLDFPLIVKDLKKLNLNAVLDGEIVALDENGISKFQLLQNRKSGNDANIYYYVFDLLHFNDKDLRQLPLIERKALLKNLLVCSTSHILYLDHIEHFGKSFFKIACEQGCEGVIGKKKNSLYKSNVRSRDWVKIKAALQQEAWICGFTPPSGSRQYFGSLILGVYKKGVLHFAGHVGGGFTEKKLQEVKNLLLPLVQQNCPFQKLPPTDPQAIWVIPKYVCEVRFSEWTNEGIMRQPIFLRLKEL